MEQINSNLKKYRQDNGYTQAQLAEALGVTRQTINAVEQGKYQPSLYLAYSMAKLFNAAIEDIFSFDE